MGGSDSGVGVMPGANSTFGLFGVGVGVNIFFTTVLSVWALGRHSAGI